MARRGPRRHFEIERLAPGVFAARAIDGGFALCNAGIVDLGGRTVVFDTMLTPMAGTDLARAAVRLTGRRPDWAVNSHWHGDHIWGNSAFERGHIVSSRKARDVIRVRSRAQWIECRREFREQLRQLDAPSSAVPARDRDWLRGWYQGVLATPRTHRFVPPNVTFEDELVLEGERRSLRLITYGGGHSPSDVFAYLPDERILFTGDLIMVGLHPSVGDGWPDRWGEILGRIEGLGVERLVPGHGPVGPGSYLGQERRYLDDLRATVRSAARREEKLRTVLATPVPARYQAWGASFFYPENLRREYSLQAAARRRAG
jgi:cyclase